MATFKDMLKYLRNREGLSQAELAQKIGLGTSTISMYEVGKREPDFETLETIADFFNVDMNFLLGKTGSENRISLTPRDERDIKKDLDSIMEKIEAGEDSPLYYNGDEVDKESMELLRDAIGMSLRHLKIINKEKYNPHKNKK
ncbi:MAG: helix-turn-helix domain-containing protein [Lachnospiraceae bacterium]